MTTMQNIIVQAKARPLVQVSIVQRPRTQVQIASTQEAEIKSTFETISQNIKALPARYVRDADGALLEAIYGGGTYVKTMDRDAGQLVAVHLSGSALKGLRLTKSYLRDATTGLLSGTSYGQQNI